MKRVSAGRIPRPTADAGCVPRRAGESEGGKERLRGRVEEMRTERGDWRAGPRRPGPRHGSRSRARGAYAAPVPASRRLSATRRIASGQWTALRAGGAGHRLQTASAGGVCRCPSQASRIRRRCNAGTCAPLRTEVSDRARADHRRRSAGGRAPGTTVPATLKPLPQGWRLRSEDSSPWPDSLLRLPGSLFSGRTVGSMPIR